MHLTPVESYIWEQPDNVKVIMDVIKSIIEDAYPEVQISLKWKVPYFTGNKSICYLNKVKKDKVEVCFLRAKLFSPDIKMHLDFKKRVMVGGITFDHLENIDEQILESIIHEAIRVDQSDEVLFIKGKTMKF